MSAADGKLSPRGLSAFCPEGWCSHPQPPTCCPVLSRRSYFLVVCFALGSLVPKVVFFRSFKKRQRAGSEFCHLWGKCDAVTGKVGDGAGGFIQQVHVGSNQTRSQACGTRAATETPWEEVREEPSGEEDLAHHDAVAAA